jgi:hypothetical protein
LAFAGLLCAVGVSMAERCDMTDGRLVLQ